LHQLQRGLVCIEVKCAQNNKVHYDGKIGSTTSVV